MKGNKSYGVFKNPVLNALIVALAMVPACGEQPTTFVPGLTDTFAVHDSDVYKQADALLQADYVVCARLQQIHER